MQGAVLQEASAKNTFWPEAGAHVGSDCAAVIATDFKAHALNAEYFECMGQYGLDGVATKTAARYPQ